MRGCRNIVPLARPHAVPGVPNNNGDRWLLGGSSHRRAGATTVRRAGNVEGAGVQVGRPGPSVQRVRLGPAISG